MKLLACVICLLLSPQLVLAAPADTQCITAPKRVHACDNLIYTSIKKAKKSSLICICKTDKPAILSLLEKNNVATQRIIIRKLLSKHQLTHEQLTRILKEIN